MAQALLRADGAINSGSVFVLFAMGGGGGGEEKISNGQSGHGSFRSEEVEISAVDVAPDLEEHKVDAAGKAPLTSYPALLHSALG